MSFDTSSEDQFNSLQGHTVTILVDGRRTNTMLGRNMILSLVRRTHPCTVLDADALYSSNADVIFGSLSEEEAQTVDILIPDSGSDLEADVAKLLGSYPNRTLIIDSLNSLLHLLPTDERSSRSRKLGFVMALCSYLARVEGRTILFTMYRREGSSSLGYRRRPISGQTDLTISAGLRGNVLALKNEKGSSQKVTQISSRL